MPVAEQSGVDANITEAVEAAFPKIRTGTKEISAFVLKELQKNTAIPKDHANNLLKGIETGLGDNPTIQISEANLKSWVKKFGDDIVKTPDKTVYTTFFGELQKKLQDPPKVQAFQKAVDEFVETVPFTFWQKVRPFGKYHNYELGAISKDWAESKGKVGFKALATVPGLGAIYLGVRNIAGRQDPNSETGEVTSSPVLGLMETAAGAAWTALVVTNRSFTKGLPKAVSA